MLYSTFLSTPFWVFYGPLAHFFFHSVFEPIDTVIPPTLLQQLPVDLTFTLGKSTVLLFLLKHFLLSLHIL